MPSKPLFSVCCIVKNGAATLPRMFASLKDFLDRGGQVVIVDTGSTDETTAVARSLGGDVTEIGDRFLRTVSPSQAEQINDLFRVQPDPDIVAAGARLFDFAAARNFAAELAREDWACWVDADEAFVNFDIDKLNEIVADPMAMQIEYDFCFAWRHPMTPDQPGYPGEPAVQFVQSKMYRHRGPVHMEWRGIVHETLAHVGGVGLRRADKADVQTLYLGHWQQPSDHRANYLPGLAVAVLEDMCDPAATADRNSHYFARELMYSGRFRSAIKEFNRHVEMQKWPAEQAQSMIYAGDCRGYLGEDPDFQAACYMMAFHIDSSRRAALVKLARFYNERKQWQASLCYAKAAMEIPWTGGFYGDDCNDYRHVPHYYAYVAAGWLARIDEAKHHLKKVLEFEPYHPDATRDAHFYFAYDPAAAPEGWMSPLELLWLYETAAGMRRGARIAEVGSWKGRSAHALASGALKSGGHVIAIDHWEGSADSRDLTHAIAKGENVYLQFLKNTAAVSKSIFSLHSGSEAAAKYFMDGTLEMTFIDAGHQYEEVRRDIKLWKPKSRRLICGHDYDPVIWPAVVAAVNDELGGPPDGVVGSIWFKRLG